MNNIRNKINKNILITDIMLIVLAIIFGYLDSHNLLKIKDIVSIPLWCFTVYIGYINAHKLTMWADRKLSNSDFGTWMRRIVSIIMSLSGIVLVFVTYLMYIGFVIDDKTKMGVPLWLFITLTLVGTFGLSIIVLSGYMEFTHERRSGSIIHIGKTRY